VFAGWYKVYVDHALPLGAAGLLLRCPWAQLHAAWLPRRGPAACYGPNNQAVTSYMRYLFKHDVW
jgi:hypothetical protein